MREIFKMNGKLMALHYGTRITCMTDDGSYDGAVINYEAHHEKLNYVVFGDKFHKRLVFGKGIRQLKVNKQGE